MKTVIMDNGIVTNVAHGDVPGGVSVADNLLVTIGMHYDGSAFTNPPPILLSKKQLIAAIEKQRDDALSAGFTYNGFPYHCDAVFQGQIANYLALYREGILPGTELVDIRRKDNVNMKMSRADLLPFAGALAVHVRGIYVASWASKDAL